MSIFSVAERVGFKAGFARVTTLDVAQVGEHANNVSVKFAAP